MALLDHNVAEPQPCCTPMQDHDISRARELAEFLSEGADDRALTMELLRQWVCLWSANLCTTVSRADDGQCLMVVGVRPLPT